MSGLLVESSVGAAQIVLGVFGVALVAGYVVVGAARLARRLVDERSGRDRDEPP